MMRVKITSEIISYGIAVLAMVLSYICASISNNAFLVLGLVIVAFLAKNIGKSSISLSIDKGYFFLMLFIIFGFLSSTWANVKDYAIVESFSYALCIVIYVFLCETFKNSKKSALDAIYVSGIIVAIYTLISYGIEVIFASIIGTGRIANTFCNVNKLGLLFAYTIIISFYKLLSEKKYVNVVVILYEMAMLLATQSRKAIIVIILGVVGVWFVYSQKKVSIKAIFKLIGIIMCIILVVLCLYRLPMFSAITERMEGLIAMVTGVGKVDGSSYLRQLYYEIGMEQFRQNPFLGIGLGNSRTAIVLAEGNHDTYTHNNFVELLCCGGIVGFVLYYSFYIYLIYILVKHKRKWTKYTKICLEFLVILLILDYGQVSFSAISNWIYLLPIFVEARRIKCK